MAINFGTIISDISTIENLLVNTFAVDVVAVFDQETMQQVIEGARPIKATVKETSKITNYPVETGSIISDFKVNNPTEIIITTVIPQNFYDSAYQQIRNLWIDATLLSIQTRTGTYRNVIIQDMPHEETADIFGAVTLDLKMREVLLTAVDNFSNSVASDYSPKNPAFSINVNKGLLSPFAVTSSILGTYNKLSMWGL